MTDFETKDSGQRAEFASGMVRDTQDGKVRYDLAFDGPLAGAFWQGSPCMEAFLAWYHGGGLELAVKLLRTMQEYEVIDDETMWDRYAELMTRGAVKYAARNWMKAQGEEELDRFKASAARHFWQWYTGSDQEEDHFVAVMFNVNGAEYARINLAFGPVEDPHPELTETTLTTVEPALADEVRPRNLQHLTAAHLLRKPTTLEAAIQAHYAFPKGLDAAVDFSREDVQRRLSEHATGLDSIPQGQA